MRWLVPGCLSMAVVYTALTAVHPIGSWLTGKAITQPLGMVSAGVTAALFWGLWIWIRPRSLEPKHAHRGLYAMACVLVANSSFYLWLVPEPEQTTNFALVSVVCGLTMLSRFWLVASLATALIGYAAVVSWIPISQAWIHWGTVLLLCQILALSVHEFRLRTTIRLIAMRRRAEREKQAASRALAALQEEVTLREESELQRLESERRLAESQRREGLGLMAGGVAHDFNNLLTTILGSTELAGIARDDAELRDALEQIESSGLRAARLCRQMLAYAGGARLERHAIDLRRTVFDALPLLESGLPKHVQIAVDPNAPEVVVNGDATELGQVIVNLVTNAAEAYGSSPGRITIELSATQLGDAEIRTLSFPENMLPGRYARLSVRDEAGGMDATTAGRIFDPFFSTKEANRGLGLAMALGIARAHGGGIDVDTEAGRGTTLSLYLPTTADAVSSEPPRSSTSTRLEPAGDGVILVVDDEERVRTTIGKVLRRAGFRLVEADCVTSAIAIDDETLSQLSGALIDLSMPDGSGVDVAHALSERRPDLHIVMMSGYDRKEVLHGPFASDLPFIGKPFRSAALLDAFEAR